jgi:LL-diaminopimelate aminotransferase
VDSKAFAMKALEETGVVVLPGSGFGPAGEGFFRIALTVGAERIAEAVKRLGGVLQETRRGALAAAR